MPDEDMKSNLREKSKSMQLFAAKPPKSKHVHIPHASQSSQSKPKTLFDDVSFKPMLISTQIKSSVDEEEELRAGRRLPKYYQHL